MASYGRAASKDYIYSEDIEKTITNFKWLVFILNVISLLTGKNVFFVSFLLQILAPQKIMLVLLGKSTRATNYLAQKTRKIQKLQMLQKYIDNLSWPFRKREYFIFGLIITKIFVTT